MDIVMVANFCLDFTENDNGRFSYIAKKWAEEGHEVEIVTTTFFHGTKSSRTNLMAEWPFKITFLQEPGYSKNVCLKRFYSHYVWGRNVGRYLKNRKQPDVIYCAVPSLTGPYLVAKYCKKNGVRFIIDIQDLWPEAFRMVFNIPIISNLIFAPLTKLADGIYSQADEICAVSQTYVDRALRVNKRCESGKVVFLGTNLEEFDLFARGSNNFKEKSEKELWLGYCGTLGSSYDLLCVFDALKIMKDKGIEPPKCIVMGDGPRKEEFENYASELGVNVVFTGKLPYPQMCSLLCKCDMTVNPIVKGAAQSIINKHADYAASGLPVLNTQECPEYRNLVEQYNMGFNCKNADAEDLAQKIMMLIDDVKLCKTMGNNARKCAEEVFDRKKSYCDLLDIIKNIKKDIFDLDKNKKRIKGV